MRQQKRMGPFDGYRTNAFFGFNVPIDPTGVTLQMGGTMYTPIPFNQTWESTFWTKKPKVHDKIAKLVQFFEDAVNCEADYSQSVKASSLHGVSKASTDQSPITPCLQLNPRRFASNLGSSGYFSSSPRDVLDENESKEFCSKKQLNFNDSPNKELDFTVELTFDCDVQVSFMKSPNETFDFFESSSVRCSTPVLLSDFFEAQNEAVDGCHQKEVENSDTKKYVKGDRLSSSKTRKRSSLIHREREGIESLRSKVERLKEKLGKHCARQEDINAKFEIDFQQNSARLQHISETVVDLIKTLKIFHSKQAEVVC